MLKQALAAILFAYATVAHSGTCQKPIYLTFDTGNMAVADHVAEVLKKHQVKATFFLANEKTPRGDFSLDDSWAAYWRERVKEGHVFASHTFDHTYWQSDVGSQVRVRSQFGEFAGKVRLVSQEQVCRDIKAVDERFKKMTGQNVSPMWRAPGGKTSPQLLQMGLQCGFAHVAWSAAGFLGDELPSDKYPNHGLLERALKNIRQGDILMAHLGIWSRKDPWAPAVLEPLIVGLKQKGFCFDLLNPQQQHPKISRIM